MPYLLLLSSTRSAPLDLSSQEAEFLIGRRQGCALVLEGDQVSRQHASITRLSGQYFLKDLGSTHGTCLNGEAIQAPSPLAFGDRIEIGGHVLLYAEAPGTPDPPATPLPPPPPSATPKDQGHPEMDPQFAPYRLFYTREMMALKRRIHEMVLTKLNLGEIATKEVENQEMLDKLSRALDAVIREIRHELPRDIDLSLFREAMHDELVGYGPISPMLREKNIDEIMVNGPDRIFVERRGAITETGAAFMDNRHLIQIIQRIVEPIGRHVDEASPMVDARLPDGSRVNAIIPPLALDGPSVTIRKFAKEKLTTDDLIRFGSMTPDIALFLEEAVRARMNIIVSGGTGSGKTTLLNVLSQFIPRAERVVTIEDSAELKLDHRNLVRLETRPPNIEGRGRISIQDLVINSLRMRPDRVIVGECRGAEALDMLQAMNTGHDGSLTTLHANNPRDALSRLENLVMMAGFELPSAAIREQIASAVDLVVQQSRLVDGTRKITHISEVTGREGDMILLQDIFLYKQRGFTATGKVQGEFAATGNIPRFVEDLKRKGDLRVDMNVFVPKV